MNRQTVEGKFDQVSGAIKQKAGETFGNQKLANSGVADQVKGAVKESWGKAKDVASERRENSERRTEEVRLHAEETANKVRDKVVDRAQSLKEDINEKLDNMRAQNRNA